MSEKILVCDHLSGKFYETTKEKINENLRQLENIINKSFSYSFYDFMEIITRDWPVDERAILLSEIKDHRHFWNKET